MCRACVSVCCVWTSECFEESVAGVLCKLSSPPPLPPHSHTHTAMHAAGGVGLQGAQRFAIPARPFRPSAPLNRLPRRCRPAAGIAREVLAQQVCVCAAELWESAAEECIQPAHPLPTRAGPAPRGRSSGLPGRDRKVLAGGGPPWNATRARACAPSTRTHTRPGVCPCPASVGGACPSINGRMLLQLRGRAGKRVVSQETSATLEGAAGLLSVQLRPVACRVPLEQPRGSIRQRAM